MYHEHVWIPMQDGTRLAARLFLPDELPASVILEALPYRMDDLTASYASEYARLCEEGGFAVCRLDLRGTGSSEGIALDEYHPQEQSDICEAIAWLADHDWSTGKVGMYGTSWGGFNSIQVAMERPPALHAIAPIYASDDRYTDDSHYMGGVLKALDLVDWELYMAAYNVLPPVPAVYGEGWREEWLRRIEGTEPWLLRWLEEQVDGTYWRHGSLRPGYDRITCPTMIVAGWADGYTNIALRAYEAMSCPRRVIIGPWSHMSTATSIPGPHVDLVPELVRWFARWLRDEPNGIDEEPPIAIFARRSTRPAPELTEMRGAWRTEPTWPAARLRPHVLRPDGAEMDRIDVRGDVGTASWISCAGKPPWSLPDDQRADDERSLVYDWDPLREDLEILGHPTVRVTITSPHPVAFLSVRLCDVFPDGTSALVSRGVLNLAHRNGHVDPAPLEVGTPTAVEVELEATSWTFEAGHRVRLALAGSDWPNTWPPPRGGTLEIDRSAIELELPVLEGESPTPPPTFAPPPAATPTSDDEEQPLVVRRIDRDRVGRQTRVVTRYGSSYGAPFDAKVTERYDGVVGVAANNPGRAWVRAASRFRIEWPETTVATEAHLDMRSRTDAYHVVIQVVAVEEGAEGIGHVERRFERTIPRRLQ
ncbi:MAG TPA: CocE/NonD family hydrolase [Gaiellaceae bacterium]|nr:CocE/NonD family hydrolase [Gaiellaceae bacterium]